MDFLPWILLAASAMVLLLLGRYWLRLYRRNRQTPSEFGKTTVHETSLKMPPDSRPRP